MVTNSRHYTQISLTTDQGGGGEGGGGGGGELSDGHLRLGTGQTEAEEARGTARWVGETRGQ